MVDGCWTENPTGALSTDKAWGLQVACLRREPVSGGWCQGAQGEEERKQNKHAIFFFSLPLAVGYLA